MKHIPAVVFLAALAAPGGADDKPKPTARRAVGSYLAAALAGKDADAAALAVKGQSPSRTARIKELRDRLGVKALKIASVLADEKKGQALAVSARVKLREANPDGRDTGVLVFALVRSGGKWLIKDVDFRGEEVGRDRLVAFKKKHPDAKEVQ